MQAARGHNVVTVSGNFAMASIRKHRGNWQVQVRRKGVGSVSRSFTLKADALEWAGETERTAQRRGLHANPKLLERSTVSELLTRYRDITVQQKRGAKNETVIINAFLRRKVAQTSLSDIGSTQFSTYRDERLKKVKPATVNRELGLLQHAFEVARKDWGIPLALNPVAAVQRPKADRPRQRRLVGCTATATVTSVRFDPCRPIFFILRE
jgi:hypothetical protein